MPHSTDVVQRWLTRICGHEGGFTLNPRDDGNWTGGREGKGELKGTKWGISAASYPHLDIANLTLADAEGIYRRDFLAPLLADSFDDGVAYQLLDFAVNSGPSAAIKALQRIVKVKEDGVPGPRTAAAAKAFTESDLVILLIAERLEFMTRAKRWKEFHTGWVNRMVGNLRYAAEDA